MKIFINPGHCIGEDTVLAFGLAEIVDTSNYWNSDLFISIHCNAADGKANGTESFYFSDEGEKLADAIQHQIVNRLGTYDRGVKFANFYVIKHT